MDARFAILGDLNNDPVDGDGEHEAILELLEHPRVLRHATPRSEGAIASAEAEGGANLQHRSAHAYDTASLNPRVGNLRLDYALPSDFTLAGSGVYWPKPGEPGAELVDASDHRLVWVDLLPDRHQAAGASLCLLRFRRIRWTPGPTATPPADAA